MTTKATIKDKYNNLDSRVKQLIENMLVFAPQNRYSIEDCLASSLFDDVRDTDLEKGCVNEIECPNGFENPKEAAKYLI